MKATQTSVSVIGVDREELRWLKTLVGLLRHPDPSVPELARQALLYLADAAEQRPFADVAPMVDDLPSIGEEPYFSGPSLVS
jgi:hypothetical protein